MQSILNMYEQSSGQSINLHMSDIFYSRNVDYGLKNSLSQKLGVSVVLGTGKYLGLPSVVGRKKKATFKYIKDRVWQKIYSWSGRMLSKAGREIMIKSVA